MLWLSVKRCFGFVAVLLLSVACHDAERNNPLDLAGSIAVDAEGYIYVADVANKRIQKFAP